MLKGPRTVAFLQDYLNRISESCVGVLDATIPLRYWPDGYHRTDCASCSRTKELSVVLVDIWNDTV